jgi:hypothetical protein
MSRLQALVFFEVKGGDIDVAQKLGMIQTKDRRWAMPIFGETGTNQTVRIRLAERLFGKGTWVNPN